MVGARQSSARGVSAAHAPRGRPDRALPRVDNYPVTVTIVTVRRRLVVSPVPRVRALSWRAQHPSNTLPQACPPLRRHGYPRTTRPWHPTSCKAIAWRSFRAPSGRQAVDLVVTSPPYADQRRKNYGGLHPDHYVEWFLPRAEAIRDSLRPTGSFVLNIKERAVNGQRHPYVLELILALREQGWRWVDEYCWHKKNAYPGKWPNRFRDAWERLLHFTLSKDFKMRQEAVMVPMGQWKDSRLRRLSATDTLRDESRHDNGFGKKVEKLGRSRPGLPDERATHGHRVRLPRPSGLFPGAATLLVYQAVYRRGRYRPGPVCRLRHDPGSRPKAGAAWALA